MFRPASDKPHVGVCRSIVLRVPCNWSSIAVVLAGFVTEWTHCLFTQEKRVAGPIGDFLHLSLVTTSPNTRLSQVDSGQGHVGGVSGTTVHGIVGTSSIGTKLFNEWGYQVIGLGISATRAIELRNNGLDVLVVRSRNWSRPAHRIANPTEIDAQLRLFHEWHDLDHPGYTVFVGSNDRGGNVHSQRWLLSGIPRKAIVGRLIIMSCDHDLPHAILAIRSSSRLPGGLNCR